MSDIKLTVNNLVKFFNRRLVFSGVSFKLEKPSSIVITGKNGSGKSTLIKILAGVLSPTKGTFTYEIENKKLDSENVFKIIGLVSPYLVLYDEFTAYENLLLFSKIRGLKNSNDEILDLLGQVGLFERRNDLLRTFSSGMKQRMKYASALLHNPSVLLLDEPTSNLDDEGKKFVEKIVSEFRTKKILVIATNEQSDYHFGDTLINLDDYKNNSKK